MQRPLALLYVPVLAVLGASVALLFPFSAEDAFITYRYAENFVETGALVFNRGEPVLALTSPLHALFSAGLHVGTGRVVLANKIVGVALLVGAAGFVMWRFRARPAAQLVAICILLLPPCVALWSVGGLETPMLLFLVSLLSCAAWGGERRGGAGAGGGESGEGRAEIGSRRLVLVFVVAGLAFLTRYDSVLFTLPVLAHVTSRARSTRAVTAAAAVGAALPVAWLVASLLYYGDVLPTSFYTKTPTVGLAEMIGNAKYVVGWLVFTGILPVALVLFTLAHARGDAVSWLREHVVRAWGLHLGLAAQLAYGLTMATTHMMFSFRFFVPYLPAVALILGDLAGTFARRLGDPGRRRSFHGAVGLTVGTMLILQAFQLHHTRSRSVNGLSLVGEYRETGVDDYAAFVAALEAQADDVRAHWAAVGLDDRLPRIYTFAGGVLPWAFRDSYVYETLASWRDCADDQPRVDGPNVWMQPTVDLRRSADYVHVITPRHGPVAPQLPKPVARYHEVSSREIVFDGVRERLLVFHDPDPEPHRLGARIHDPCPTG